MFKNITDPYTKKKYSTSSPEGKHILNQYINNYNSKGQKGGASMFPRNSTPNIPSITINSPTLPGPQKGYLDLFLNLKDPPLCSDKQMGELNILIDTINKKILENTRSVATESVIEQLKKEKEKLKNNPDDTLINSLVMRFNSSPNVRTLNSQHQSAKRSLGSKNKHIQNRNTDVQGLEYRIKDKRGLTSTDSDFEQLSRWRYDLTQTDTDNEITNENRLKKN